MIFLIGVQYCNKPAMVSVATQWEDADVPITTISNASIVPEESDSEYCPSATSSEDSIIER